MAATRGGVRAPILLVVVAGLALTIGLSLAARSAYRDNERRILEQRADEVVAVLTAAVSGIETPLTTNAELVEAEPDPAVFERVMGTQVGPERRFVSASLWLAGDPTGPVEVIGGDPALASLPPADVEAFLGRAVDAPAMAVLDLVDGPEPRLGYGMTTGAGVGHYVVYAEQALPPDRTNQQTQGDAFADLDYSVRLDSATASDTVLLANLDPFPSDHVASSSTPLGDGELRTLVHARENLSGDLLASLWWIALVAGVAMTTGIAALTMRVERGRARAEDLATRVNDLYADQRRSSLALQQRLLPSRLPDIEGLELACSYTPGVEGTEVGGDWFDVADLATRTVLIVGDTSGRGLAAAGVMAGVRHAARAYALQGDDPATILGKVHRSGALELDGHFVTVVCAVLDRVAGTLEVATAGHPPPVVGADGDATLLELPVGPPIGAAYGTTYRSVTLELRPGAAVALFTDGLFERRGEGVDVGLERVRRTVAAAPPDAEGIVEALRRDLMTSEGEDDTAILVARWRDGAEPRP